MLHRWVRKIEITRVSSVTHQGLGVDLRINQFCDAKIVISHIKPTNISSETFTADTPSRCTQNNLQGFKA